MYQKSAEQEINTNTCIQNLKRGPGSLVLKNTWVLRDVSHLTNIARIIIMQVHIDTYLHTHTHNHLTSERRVNI